MCPLNWENKGLWTLFYYSIQCRHHTWLPIYVWDLQLWTVRAWLCSLETATCCTISIVPCYFFVKSSGNLRLLLIPSHRFITVANWLDWGEDTQPIPKVPYLYPHSLNSTGFWPPRTGVRHPIVWNGDKKKVLLSSEKKVLKIRTCFKTDKKEKLTEEEEQGLVLDGLMWW